MKSHHSLVISVKLIFLKSLRKKRAKVHFFFYYFFLLPFFFYYLFFLSFLSSHSFTLGIVQLLGCGPAQGVFPYLDFEETPLPLSVPVWMEVPRLSFVADIRSGTAFTAALGMAVMVGGGGGGVVLVLWLVLLLFCLL
jgi:hypothetical protein